MLRIDIPGRGVIVLHHVVFDFNGTLAEDGEIQPSTISRLQQIGESLDVIVATADTFGTAEAAFTPAGIVWHKVQAGQDKERLVQELGEGVVAVGNGANDALMFRAATLSIAILGPEGCARGTLQAADVIAPSIDAGLELLLYPQRIVATLRE